VSRLDEESVKGKGGRGYWGNRFMGSRGLGGKGGGGGNWRVRAFFGKGGGEGGKGPPFAAGLGGGGRRAHYSRRFHFFLFGQGKGKEKNLGGGL